jgi:hypothetical protein
MEIKSLDIASGWLWIKQGSYLFKKSPALLIALSLIAIAGAIGVASIPTVGEPFSAFLFPVIFSGLLWGCHALEHDEELELAHLFIGFQRNTQKLVMLGALNLLGNYLILGVMKITGGGELVDLMMSNSPDVDPAVIMHAVSGGAIAIVISIILSIIFLMATQFAPMLVTFNKLSPLAALKASLLGSWRNLVPLSVYGVMMMLFMIVATLPLMLGWFVLLPIMVTSIYAAYRGIFPGPDEVATSEPVTPDPEV